MTPDYAIGFRTTTAMLDASPFRGPMTLLVYSLRVYHCAPKSLYPARPYIRDVSSGSMRYIASMYGRPVMLKAVDLHLGQHASEPREDQLVLDSCYQVEVDRGKMRRNS